MSVYIFALLALVALAGANPFNDTTPETIDPRIQACLESSLEDRDILQEALEVARENMPSTAAAVTAPAVDYLETTETSTKANSGTWDRVEIWTRGKREAVDNVEEDAAILADYSPSDVEAAQAKIDHVNQMVADFYDDKYPGAENRKTRYLLLKSIMLELDLMVNDRMKAQDSAPNSQVSSGIVNIARSVNSCYALLTDCYEKEDCLL